MHVTFEASVHPLVVAMTGLTTVIGNAPEPIRLDRFMEMLGQVRPQPDLG